LIAARGACLVWEEGEDKGVAAVEEEEEVVVAECGRKA
jgi:hypothetical protein